MMPDKLSALCPDTSASGPDGQHPPLGVSAARCPVVRNGDEGQDACREVQTESDPSVAADRESVQVEESCAPDRRPETLVISDDFSACPSHLTPPPPGIGHEGTPAEELTPAGPDVAGIVAGIETRAQRDGRGRFLKGGQAASIAGTRSTVLLEALAPAQRAIVDAVTADTGAGADGPPQTLRRLIDAFSQTTLLREAVFCRMAGEPTTAKGHSRRLLAAYMQLVDRELRLAQAIGLERRSKRQGFPWQQEQR